MGFSYPNYLITHKYMHCLRWNFFVTDFVKWLLVAKSDSEKSHDFLVRCLYSKLRIFKKDGPNETNDASKGIIVKVMEKKSLNMLSLSFQS